MDTDAAQEASNPHGCDHGGAQHFHLHPRLHWCRGRWANTSTGGTTLLPWPKLLRGNGVRIEPNKVAWENQIWLAILGSKLFGATNGTADWLGHAGTYIISSVGTLCLGETQGMISLESNMRGIISKRLLVWAAKLPPPDQ